MDWFRVTLDVPGPTGTPWQADTIFGHLCWAVKHRRGEEALRRFLEPFLEGKPPLLLSSGFPSGLLPRPVLPVALPQGASPEDRARARDLRKQELVSAQDFQRCIATPAHMPGPVPRKSLVQTRVTLKNQLNRITGTTGDEGQLFNFEEHWLPQVDIYVKVANGHKEEAEELFGFLAESGYGKRKSVGYGAIRGVQFQPFEGSKPPPGADGFVTLSPFVPSASDPTEGFWRTRVKYGKLGEERAVSANPFKRPVLMLAEGSAFYDAAPREWYGRMVTGLSDAFPDVVHYGYALPVPAKLPSQREV